MKSDQKDCAPESMLSNWKSINWKKVKQSVKSLQLRIAKAIKEGKHNKAKALQWVLTHSFSAKLLAVKRVTENSGKRTPGTDGVRWKTPTRKLRAALSLSRKGYQAKPLRRLYILKKNGKKRPLGIPTMKDRAFQALHLLALEPVAETLADKGSYGFRQKRSCHDAIERCYIHLSRKDSATWILETRVMPLIEAFRAERGLQLSTEKTKITHITEGFDFLGQNIRMYSCGRLLIRPSKVAIRSVKEKLKGIIVKHRGSQAAVLIRNLNPVITGWANYHRHVCSKRIFYKMDRILWRNIWNWARRRHNNLGYRRIVSLLFMRIGNRKWQFFGKFDDGKMILLRMFACFQIRRHRLINGDANPYDPAWDYYFSRRLTCRNM